MKFRICGRRASSDVLEGNSSASSSSASSRASSFDLSLPRQSKASRWSFFTNYSRASESSTSLKTNDSFSSCESSEYDNYTLKDWLAKSEQEFLNRMESPLLESASLEDFEQIRTIGTGATGIVKLVQDKHTRVYYALKVVNKQRLSSYAMSQILTEKSILAATKFPFLISLHHYFEDQNCMYLLMDFAIGGNLRNLIVKKRGLSELHAKFYAAQLVLTLEYLHNLNLLHRDLKPENILISRDGYIQVADFGASIRTLTRTGTFTGTPDYLPPEVIYGKKYHKSVDWWSLGVTLFEMVATHTPFELGDDSELYVRTVSSSHLKFPKSFSPQFKYLLKHLLKKNISERWGCSEQNDIDKIKDASWFQEIDWDAVFHKKIKAPYLPQVSYSGDTKYFL